MIDLHPTVLEGGGIRLEPLTDEHTEALGAAAADGRLWEIWFTAVPPPDGVRGYIADALQGQREGRMLPWAVRDLASGAVIGSTRYHDIVPALERVEIGYTFYAQSRHRTHVNTTCKLLLLGHAFETLGCKAVGLRTDTFNFRSQRADRGARREEGRCDPAFRRPARRHGPRHGDVQHPRERVARREAPPRAAAAASRALARAGDDIDSELRGQ